MVDYQIDRTFQAVRTDWGTFKEVSGIAEFEQTLIVALHDEFQPLIGDLDSENLIPRIRLAVTRIANKFDVIGKVKQINISRVADASGEYEVNITYKTSAPFSEVF